MTMENLELIAIGAGAVALGAVYMNSRKHVASGRGSACANAKRSQPLAKAVSSRAAAPVEETPVPAMEESGFETTMDQPENFHVPTDAGMKAATRTSYEMRNGGYIQKMDAALRRDGLDGGAVSQAIGSYIPQPGQPLHNNAKNPKLTMCENGLGLPANAAMEYAMQSQEIEGGPSEAAVDMDALWSNPSA